MLEKQVRAGDSIPACFLRIQEQKARAEALAEHLGLVDASLSQKIAHCADVLTFIKFPSQYRKLKGARFCRQRGCPACEAARTSFLRAKILTAMASAKRVEQLSGVIASTSFNELMSDPDEYRAQVTMGCKAIQRLVQRKSFKADGWFCLLQPAIKEQGIVITAHLIVNSKMQGKQYVSSATLQRIWTEVSASPVGERYLDRRIVTDSIQESVWAATEQPDLMALHPHIALKLIESLHRIKMSRSGGCYRGLLGRMRPDKRKNTQTPRRQAAEKEWFGYSLHLESLLHEEDVEGYYQLPEY